MASFGGPPQNKFTILPNKEIPTIYENKDFNILNPQHTWSNYNFFTYGVGFLNNTSTQDEINYYSFIIPFLIGRLLINIMKSSKNEKIYNMIDKKFIKINFRNFFILMDNDLKTQIIKISTRNVAENAEEDQTENEQIIEILQETFSFKDDNFKNGPNLQYKSDFVIYIFLFLIKVRLIILRSNGDNAEYENMFWHNRSYDNVSLDFYYIFKIGDLYLDTTSEDTKEMIKLKKEACDMIQTLAEWIIYELQLKNNNDKFVKLYESLKEKAKIKRETTDDEEKKHFKMLQTNTIYIKIYYGLIEKLLQFKKFQETNLKSMIEDFPKLNFDKKKEKLRQIIDEFLIKLINLITEEQYKKTDEIFNKELKEFEQLKDEYENSIKSLKFDINVSPDSTNSKKFTSVITEHVQVKIGGYNKLKIKVRKTKKSNKKLSKKFSKKSNKKISKKLKHYKKHIKIY